MANTDTANKAGKAGIMIAGAIAAWMASGCGVPVAEQATRAGTQGETKRFPEYTAKDLNGKMVTVPGNGSSTHALVLVAFKRKQQRVIDGWLAEAKPLMKGSPDLDFLELPVIRKMNPVTRWFLFRGMRSGIRGEYTRERVVTLHLDKEKFRRDLEIPDESAVHVFLVRRADRAILWRAKGEVTSASMAALKEQLTQVRSAPLRGS